MIDERRIHVDFCQSVAKIWKNRVFGVPIPQKELANMGLFAVFAVLRFMIQS